MTDAERDPPLQNAFYVRHEFAPSPSLESAVRAFLKPEVSRQQQLAFLANQATAFSAKQFGRLLDTGTIAKQNETMAENDDTYLIEQVLFQMNESRTRAALLFLFGDTYRGRLASLMHPIAGVDHLLRHYDTEGADVAVRLPIDGLKVNPGAILKNMERRLASPMRYHMTLQPRQLNLAKGVVERVNRPDGSYHYRPLQARPEEQ